MLLKTRIKRFVRDRYIRLRKRFLYIPPQYNGPLCIDVENTFGYKMSEEPIITNHDWIINIRR